MSRLIRCIVVAVLGVGVLPGHAQWIKTNGPDGVRALAAGDVALADDVGGSAVVAGSNQGVLLTIDQGETWEGENVGLSGVHVSSLLASHYRLFAGNSAGGVHRSIDGAVTWVSASSGLMGSPLRSFVVNDSGLFAATGSGVFRASDHDGSGWTDVSGTLPADSVHALSASGLLLYAGTDSGVYRSDDQGVSWLGLHDMMPRAPVRVLFAYGASVFAATDSGMFRSASDGMNWSSFDAGLPAVRVHGFAYHSGNLFAATDSGVFRITRLGSGWTAVNDGLPTGAVHAIVAYSHSALYVALDDGIWRRPLSEVTVSVRPEPAIPSSSVQLQMVGRHSVSFALPARTPVSLTLHDLSGRTRATLLSGKLSAGNHTARLDAAALPVGLYFVRLQTPELAAVRRVLLGR